MSSVRAKRLSKLPVGRLVALFAVLTFVPLALLSWFSVSLATRAARNQVNTTVRSTATVSASLIQAQIEGVRRLVVSYGRRPSLVTALADGDPAHMDKTTLHFH